MKTHKRQNLVLSTITNLSLASLLVFMPFQLASSNDLDKLTKIEQNEPFPNFFNKSEEGWFWYDDPDMEELLKVLDEIEETEPPVAETHEPKEDKLLNEQVQVTKANVTESDKSAFSVSWLRKWMPVLLDRAIDNPTKDNVEAYELAKRIAMDKAQRYAEMTQVVVNSNPFLDENNRIPLATFAKKDFLNRRTENLGDALKYLSEKAGIWFFFDSTCDFCYTQSYTIQKLEEEFKFDTRYVSVDGNGMPHLKEWYLDEGQAKALNLTITPTTALVVPPDQVYIVSQGAMAYDQLQERILLAAESNDLLPEEFKKSVNAFSKGVLTTEDMSDGASDDPAIWVPRLKERLEVRY